MLTTTITNGYESLREFVVMNRLMLPKPTETWRLVKDQPSGSIVGLPTIQGIAVATNGILVAIERSDNSILFCHLEWFKCDKGEIETIREAKAIWHNKTTKPSLDPFVAELMNFGKSSQLNSK